MEDKKYLEKYLKPSKLKEGLEKLKQGLPVQYIVGNVIFYGHIIEVNENVLIPRFETELLVSKTIDYINKTFNKKINILDIGTGSGAISIALKSKLNCNIDAVDISKKALEVAIKNAKNNNTDINFFQSDVFSNVENKYDVIISNPPYISKEEKIDDIVKNNEPDIALFADNNGLEFYEKILSKAHKFITTNAIIAFEIGMTQAKEITEIAKKYFPNSELKVEKDYPGKDRFIFIFIN